MPGDERRRGDAEVDQLHLTFFVEHHVPRRDVAMNDLHAAVRVVERATHLHADVRALFRGQDALRRAVEVPLAHQLRDAAALDELHREEVRALLDAELVDGDDVRVAQRDGRLRFFDEAPDELLVERQLVADLLHDELLLEAAGAAQRREHDARHAAARELALEHVLAEDLRIHDESKRIRSAEHGAIAPRFTVHCATDGRWRAPALARSRLVRSAPSSSSRPCAPSCKPSTRFEDRPLVVYSPRSLPGLADRGVLGHLRQRRLRGRADPRCASLYLREVGNRDDRAAARARARSSSTSRIPRRASTGEAPPRCRRQAPDQRPRVAGRRDVPAHAQRRAAHRGDARRLRSSPDGRRRQRARAGRPDTFVGDLSTGIVADLASSVSERGARAPPSPRSATRPIRTRRPRWWPAARIRTRRWRSARAEIYVPEARRATATSATSSACAIDLGEPRTKHGAVVLASGETLLVGGIGQSGAPLSTMEIVDPEDASLPHERRRDAGAYRARARPCCGSRPARSSSLAASIAATCPCPTIEWFSPDASRPDQAHGRSRDRPGARVRPARGRRRARGRPPARRASPTSRRSGSSPPTARSSLRCPSIRRTLESACGSSRAPTARPCSGPAQRWLRWQPWFGAFQPIADAPPRGPRGTAIASGDPGLALWLDDRADIDENVLLENLLYVRGYRFATRSRFGTVRNPLLVDRHRRRSRPIASRARRAAPIRFIDGQGPRARCRAPAPS